MNSILRQSHIRSADLRDFMHNYDSTNTIAVSSWVKTSCAGLEPGALIFIVEPVTLPFGLISFSRKEEEDNFRVTDFAILVRIEDGKAMVVGLTSNNYELRFLESLLEERARKAIIDRKTFSFVIAKPTSPLGLTKFQELERLSNLYAKGGSRRSFMSANAQEEPVIALLGACGAHLNFTSINKQPPDIGSICHSLFSTESKLPDSNRSHLRDIFVPLSSDSSALKSIVTPSVTSDTGDRPIDLLIEKSAALKSKSGQEITGFNLLQSWGGSKDAALSSAHRQGEILEQSSPSQENSSFNQKNLDWENKQESSSFADESKTKDNFTDNSTQSIPDTNQPEDVYKHLSEAITDLLGVQNPVTDSLDKNATDLSKIDVQQAKFKEGKASKWPAARSFEKLPAFQNPLVPIPNSSAVTAVSGIAPEQTVAEQSLPEQSLPEQSLPNKVFPNKVFPNKVFPNKVFLNKVFLNKVFLNKCFLRL